MSYSHAVVYGSLGPIGSAFAFDLAEVGCDVIGVDSRPGAELTVDVTAPDPQLAEALGQADLVVIALPEELIAPAFARVFESARPGTLVVDTMSFKAEIPEVLAANREAALTLDFLGVDPMQTPKQSYSNVSVVQVPYGEFTPPERAAEFEAWLQSRGARVVEKNLEDHAAMVTAQQSLTHAAMISYGFSLIEDPEAGDGGALDVLAARTSQNSVHVYWGIQTNNPEAVGARNRLIESLQGFDTAARAHNVQAIAELTQRVQDKTSGVPASYLDSGVAPLGPRAQAAALAFGDALASFDIDLAEALVYGTPPFKLMVRAAAQASRIDVEVIVEAQGTERAATERGALVEAVRNLDALAQSGDDQKFERNLAASYDAFGSRLATLVAAFDREKVAVAV